MYDAIIVGARVAGSATGMLLARRGLRVLIVDRATFPSDTMSTQFIHTAAAKMLRDWGLLDEVLATGCPPIPNWTARMEQLSFVVDQPTVGDMTFAVCPRRTVLDEIMVRAAREAGAEVRTATSLRELAWEDGAVTGVVIETDGVRTAEHARIVIGADGRRSTIAKLVDAKHYNEVPSVAYWYYNYFPDLDVDPGLYFVDQWGGGANPTNDGAWVVVAGGPAPEFEIAKQDVPGHFQKILDAGHPELGAQCRERGPLERYVGTADVPGFFREVVGNGWTLIGDAGLHKDPITGSGITEAFAHATILVEELASYFAGDLTLNEALTVYKQRRDAHSKNWYEWTALVARLNPIRPEMLALFGQMREDRAKANLFGRVNSGLMSMQRMFAELTGAPA